MEDYKVLQTGDEIQEILNQAPVDTADIAELKEAATSLDGRLEAVEGKIPSGASSENPLTDKQYVDSSIASASATFRGTYNEVTDLELTTEATHAEIGEALASVIDTADSNDYCFVQIPTADATPTEIESIERYKFVTGTGWQYEYTLNNSGFTADQWAAINSGITSGLVAKLTDLPTNAELNTLLNGKANAADVYTKSETYNKTEMDAQLSAKANSADVYEKSQTYTKQEVDALITTPEVQYVTVTATAGTTSVTDVLPATGAANTIYRVGSWDGTQYATGVYSEYAWNGTTYILLDVKNYGFATGSDFDNPTTAQRELVTTVGSVLDGMPEGVFDVSARNSGSTWASLSALLSDADLDTLIPASWRKGGMTIRFVQTSDNKYVEYFLTHPLDNASTAAADFANTANWQKLNLEEEVNEGLYNEHTPEIRITDGISVFKGLARISTAKFEASTSATAWIRYIPVVAGKKYRIRTTVSEGEQNYVPINTAWMGVMFSENAPANAGNATSIKNYSSSPAEVDEYYTAQANGYVGVGINGSSAFLTRIKFWEVVTTKTLKTDDLQDEIDDIDERLSTAEDSIDTISSDITALDGRVDNIEDDLYYNEEHTVTQVVADRTTYNGIARISTAKYEDGLSTANTIYIPVVAGRQYSIKTTQQVTIQDVWMTIAFSTSVPNANVSAVNVKSYSTSPTDINETYTPQENGYLGVCLSGDISQLGPRIVFTETYLETVKVPITDDLLVETEKEVQLVLEDKVSGLMMRLTNLQFEATTSTRYVFYIPCISGTKYKVCGTNVTLGGSTWSMIGFSTNIPTSAGSYTDVLHFDSDGSKTFIQEYFAPSNGYLCIFYQDSLNVLSNRLQVYKYVTNTKRAMPLLQKGMLYESGVAKTILASAPVSFNIGLTNMRAIVDNPDNLSISSSGSNYNECIAQYMNAQEGKRTSKLIKVAEHNLDPNIGDFSTLSSTYWREVIGIDSEGWIYCAQRKYSNLSQGNDVNIYKTKDFDTFTVFKSNSCGHQLIELENGELCFATYETEEDGGSYYIRCNIYVTSQHKTVFNKKFSCTQIGQYQPAAPWSWGIQSRGSVVAIGEYGQHGNCGKVWYSRDYGEHFYEVFDLRDKAPDVPHAHVHGVCVDPYFDRVYIINGDGSPSTTPELAYKNPRLWYWDYNGETLSDNLKNTIDWQYVACGEDVSMGSNLQFVNGYALKDCIVFFSDGANNGIFRINRTTKEDTPVMDFAYHLGIDANNTKWCGGNMFRRDDNSPLLICGIREYSQDFEPTDPNNPSHKPNTYKDVLSRVYATYDGYKFFEVWIDDTYGQYTVHYTDGTSEQRNLAKCGRDMSVWQMYGGKVLLKYLGRDFQYVSYNDNGVTRQKNGYVNFANYVAEFLIK